MNSRSRGPFRGDSLFPIMIALAAQAVCTAAAPEKRTVVWDLKALFEVPKVHTTEERPAKGMRSFFYEGADYKGKPTWVFAYYAAPEGTAPAGGWPAVVCAHGGGGTAYPEWVKYWNRKGYAAIAMDLEGHLPGGKSHQVEGNFPAGQAHDKAGPSRIDWFGDRDLPDKEQWFYHAVADVVRANSLLRAVREINKEKIGLTGISWGGTVASAVAGIDPRLAFVIPVYGGGYIHESDNPGLAQWFPPKNMTPTQFRDYRTKWDPSAHLPHAKMPMLWVTSVADPVFQIDIFAKSAQAAAGPSTLCMRPWMIHAHGNGWNDALEIGQFADSIVKGGPPLPKLARPEIDRGTGLVHTKFTGNEKISEAWIYLTTSKGNWKGRKWHFIQCKIGEKELVAQKQLPEGTTAFLVYVFKDVGGFRSNHAASELVLTDEDTPNRPEAGANQLKGDAADKPMVFSDPTKNPTIPAVGGVRWFWPTHARNYERRKAGNIDLCFLGDSITQGWPGDMFTDFYGKLNAVNFGCGGDKIQHLLMRLEGDDGELKGTSPRVVVLLIGINNMGDNTAEEIAYGTKNMVNRIKRECPKTKILLLAILPTKGTGGDKIKAVNALTAKLDDRKRVRFLDMGAKFRGEDGKAVDVLYRDNVHLSRKGYELWHVTMNPLLTEMMGK